MCGRCRVVRRDARFHLLLPTQVQVKLHLVFEIVRKPLAVEQHADASDESSELFHGGVS